MATESLPPELERRVAPGADVLGARQNEADAA